TFESVIEHLKRQPITTYCDPTRFNYNWGGHFKLYPLTTDECYSPVVKRTEIKISKQNKVKLNINKPKI
ncbi:MAG TPA: hypothetical protein VJ916_03235, partial [Anaerovoracaceae bacterium]|nr:hypothetical protein [Anaerovoracaceae bacterium]